MTTYIGCTVVQHTMANAYVQYNGGDKLSEISSKPCLNIQYNNIMILLLLVL